MTVHGWIALAVVAAVMVGMAAERVRAHRVALAGFAVLLATGCLDAAQARAVVGSTGLVTVLCMFVVAAAVEHVGLVDDAVRRLMRGARAHPRSAWLLFFAALAGVSAVVPNTPLVVLAAPAALLLAQRTGTGDGRVLIPVAFVASLGGALSLIGSSVNVVGGSVLAEHGGLLGLFTQTPVALVALLAGALTLWLLGPRLLPPGRVPRAEGFDPALRVLFEEVVGESDPRLGRPLGDSVLRDPAIEVVDVIRSGVLLSPPGPTLAGSHPHPGDRLLLRMNAGERARQATPTPHDPRERRVIEVWVPAFSRLVGLPVGELRLDRIHGIELLGVAPLAAIPGALHAHRLGPGDRLLLAGAREDLERLLAQESVFGPLQIERSRQARSRAPLVGAGLLFLVATAASGLLALEVAALVTAITLVVTGTVPMRHRITPVLLRTLGIVLGMLGIGAALEATGASEALARPVIESAGLFGPLVLLVAAYVVATTVTEFVTNNGAIVLVMPIALVTAQSLGLDPLPFALAVLFGAGASFGTPIGYQTNTLVYELGRYRFADFVRIGLPMKLAVGVATLAAIAWLHPLQ